MSRGPLAINKRKLLSSAQKNLAKGALDKALRDYLTVLEADPRDANVRLKVGDLHLRRGERDEAITAYRKVADQFMRDGFDAKAVALYKQITKIDPKRYDSYVPLADLYHRLGLVSDAMKALQTAADALNREGRKREALEVLRRLASLDPSNTTSRLKVAELLRQAGLQDEAVAEYEEAANELARQGDWEGQLAVLERVLEVRPTQPKALEGLARTWVERGRADRAEAFAKRLLALDDSRPESFEVLASVYDALDRRQEAIGVYRELAALHRGRGDEDRAAEILQRHVPTEALALEDAPGLELDDASFTPVPVGAEIPSLGTPSASGPELEDEFLDESDGGFEALPMPATDETSAALPEGDPEQLLAEASVYLRYGKHDRAIQSLQGVLKQRPDSAAALEKLGEVHAALGDTSQALAAYLRAADLVSAAGQADHFDVLRGRIAALDPEAAAEIEALAPRAPGEALAPSADAGQAADDSSLFDEIDVEIDARGLEPEPPAAAVPDDETPSLQIGEDEPSLETDALPFDDGVFELESSGPQQPAPSAAATPEESSASAAQQIGEELEEASFYFDQGMLDEAEAIYKRIQRTAPHHPQVLLRLGEIAAARGEAPVLPGSEPDVLTADVPELGAAALPPPPAASADALAEALGPADDLEIEIDAAGPPGPAERPESESMARTIADLGDLGIMDSAWEVAEETGRAVPEAEVTEVPFGEEPAWDTATPQAPVVEDPQAAGDDHFDLAEALSGSFDGEESGAPASDEGAFDAIFQEFKRGVSETLGEGDVETRYDLGIAYREMGLFDDAIAEFRIVLGSPQRRLDALHMMSLCALDLERPEDAVAHLEQALASPDVPLEREIPLRFDLGRAYQMQEDGERALEAFRRVAAIDPDFQDVAVRLGGLERQRSAGAQPVDPEGEAYESFDDLVAEAGIADAEERSEQETEEPVSVVEFEPEAAVAAEPEAEFAVEAEPEEDFAASGSEPSAPTEAPALEAAPHAEDDESASEEEFLAEFVSEAPAEVAAETSAEPEPAASPPEPEPVATVRELERAEPKPEPPAPGSAAPVAASPEPLEPDPAPETPAPRRRKRKISFV